MDGIGGGCIVFVFIEGFVGSCVGGGGIPSLPSFSPFSFSSF